MLRKLLIIAATLLLLFFAYKFVKAKGLLPNEIFSKIEEKIPQNINLPWRKDEDLKFDQLKLNQNDLEKLGENGVSQVKILAEKAKEAGVVAQDFVEKVVQEDKGSDKNISEKAFDYGKYIYCQEVVKQYEASRSTTTF